MIGIEGLMKQKLEFCDHSFSYKQYVEEAFILGLWYRSLPDYTFDGLNTDGACDEDWLRRSSGTR